MHGLEDKHLQNISEGTTYMLVSWLEKKRILERRSNSVIYSMYQLSLPMDSLTSHFQSDTPCSCPGNIRHWAAVHSCITECQTVDHQLWPPSNVHNPPTLSKEKQTPILLPSDLWSRDASEGAHQFKAVSLSVSRWCWQVHYGRSSCGEERYTYGLPVSI